MFSLLVPPLLSAALIAAGSPADVKEPERKRAAALRLLQDEDNTEKNLRRSLSLFEEAIAGGLPEPRAADAHARRAIAFLRLGDLEPDDGEAAKLYQRGVRAAEAGITLSERCAQCHFARASCLGRGGQRKGVMKSLWLLDEVKGGFEKAVELEPGHLDAHFALGVIDAMLPFFAGGDADRAEARFRRLLRKEPRFTREMLDLAELLYREDRPEEAREWALRVLREKEPLRPGEHRKFDVPRARALLSKLK